jgi:hypothetical protein
MWIIHQKWRINPRCKAAPKPKPANEKIEVIQKVCTSLNPAAWKSILAKIAAEITSKPSRNTRNQATITNNMKAAKTATIKVLVFDLNRTFRNCVILDEGVAKLKSKNKTANTTASHTTPDALVSDSTQPRVL